MTGLGYSVGDIVFVFSGSQWYPCVEKGVCAKVTPSGQVTVKTGTVVKRFNSCGRELGGSGYSTSRIIDKDRQDEKYASVRKEAHRLALVHIWREGFSNLHKLKPCAESVAALRKFADAIESKLAVKP